MQHIQTLRRSLGAAAATGLMLAQQAYAAVPTEAEKALTDAQADGIKIAGIVLGIIIAIAAFKYIRRAL
ncbi:major capsid protein [Pseudomonas anguilliseptica]|uniref:major capsid protein n=1 Tax=Pseudomonas anguilliseptica TaxID=53406 RepID=UPI003735F57D